MEGGGGGALAMMKWDTKGFGKVLTWEFDVLATLKGVGGGGAKSCNPLKEGA